MNRRAFVTGLGAVLAAARGAEAQQTGNVYHVGWLRYMPCQERGPSGDLLQEGLRERGYVDTGRPRRQAGDDDDPDQSVLSRADQVIE